MWTLEESLALARELEPLVSDAGWHVALAGGVLLRGASDHDLDLVFYPHNVRDFERDAARGWQALRVRLKAFGWRRRADSASVQAEWRKKGSTDTKHVEVWATADGRRVDVIVVS